MKAFVATIRERSMIRLDRSPIRFYAFSLWGPTGYQSVLLMKRRWPALFITCSQLIHIQFDVSSCFQSGHATAAVGKLFQT